MILNFKWLVKRHQPGHELLTAFSLAPKLNSSGGTRSKQRQEIISPGHKLQKLGNKNDRTKQLKEILSH
jgi:hypothetical protein